MRRLPGGAIPGTYFEREIMTIIEQLKANEKPFGLMTNEMQREMVRHKLKGHRQVYSGSSEWEMHDPDTSLNTDDTYRLRADYTEQPEIVECEIYTKDSSTQGVYIKVYDFGHQKGLGLGQYPDGYKRIGFKFADGTVMGKPVKYSVPGITTRGYFATYEDIVTGQALEHHAIIVLFRGEK